MTDNDTKKGMGACWGYFPYELKKDYPDGVMLKACWTLAPTWLVEKHCMRECHSWTYLALSKIHLLQHKGRVVTLSCKDYRGFLTHLQSLLILGIQLQKDKSVFSTLKINVAAKSLSRSIQGPHVRWNFWPNAPEQGLLASEWASASVSMSSVLGHRPHSGHLRTLEGEATRRERGERVKSEPKEAGEATEASSVRQYMV